MHRPTLLLFFFNATATTEIYTLSLHDALPICRQAEAPARDPEARRSARQEHRHRRDQLEAAAGDRKSTRLNSSHSQISYAVFCLKKKIEARIAKFVDALTAQCQPVTRVAHAVA